MIISIPLFHRLRRTSWLTQLVLLWFVATWAAMQVSSMLPQQHGLSIYSTSHSQPAAHDEDVLGADLTLAAHCPLCLAPGLMAGLLAPLLAAAPTPVATLPVILLGYSAVLVGAPPPARAPPGPN